MNGIASTVAGMIAGRKVFENLDVDAGVGQGKCGHDVVAFDVNVGVDAMGHLEGKEGESDGGVVGRSGEPVHLVTAGSSHPLGTGQKRI